MQRGHCIGRWIIVSNRLPFSYDKATKKLKPCSGGLVTAIKGVKTDDQVVWVGSAAQKIPKKLMDEFQAKEPMRYSSVYLEQNLYDTYYNDFCNDVLWPILHYETDHVKYREYAWEAYKKVNQIFAEHILKIAKAQDIIWIHDFHLFLVPELLKKANPKLKIGFFLHVPFPSSEIFRQLPCRYEILKSMIFSDLVGFHDYSYLRHFSSSVYNVLGIHNSMLEIKYSHHICKMGVYPVSIDTYDFLKKSNGTSTKKYFNQYQQNKNGIKYLLGVDRLDYTKGILLKLEAFKFLLESHPELIGKIQLIQIAVPSRTEVPEYVQLRKDVERLVGEINGKFSTIDYIPVRYIFNSINIHELLALYRISDVLFVTSKRDGMNLVCLEYVTAQQEDDPGVVILSEFAGAASTLSRAILINPMDIAKTAKTVFDVLYLDKDERIERNTTMINFLKNYTASDWASAFINDLGNRDIEHRTKTIDLSHKKTLNEVIRKIRNKNSILLLDYDGTLAPIHNHPEDAIIEDDMKEVIKRLAKDNNKEIVIVSGRPVNFLQKQFKGIDVYIAGEHGGVFYDWKRKKWRTLVSSGKNIWYEQALEIVRLYTKRTPSSFMEKKDHAITWHFRNAPADFGEFQARKLVVDLETSLANMPVNVIMGKKVVEIKAVEANKGYFANWFSERYLNKHEQIVAMGDDRTDEDMFSTLAPDAITIKVGDPFGTSAKYNIAGQEDVVTFLSQLQ